MRFHRHRCGWSFRLRHALPFLLLLPAVGGCQSVLPEQWDWLPESADSKVPDRMMTLWTDTVMNAPGQAGVRGIGGRVFFYRADRDRSVKVDGQLTVYAYDDSEEKRNVPTRKFVFLSEQFAKHYSKSKLGHSYSVWLPFGDVGGPSRHLTLIARFEPRDGGAVLSEPARHFLPGAAAISLVRRHSTNVAVRRLANLPTGEVTPVGHVDSAATVPTAHTDAVRKLETITIDIPLEFATRARTVSPGAPAARTQPATVPTLGGERAGQAEPVRAAAGADATKPSSRPRSLRPRSLRPRVAPRPRPAPDVQRPLRSATSTAASHS